MKEYCFTGETQRTRRFVRLGGIIIISFSGERGKTKKEMLRDFPGWLDRKTILEIY